MKTLLAIALLSLSAVPARAADFKFTVSEGNDSVSLEQIVLPQKDGAFRVLNVLALQCNEHLPIRISFVAQAATLDAARGYGAATALLLANGAEGTKLAERFGIISPDYTFEIHSLVLGHVHETDETERDFVALSAALAAESNSAAAGYFTAAGETFGYEQEACTIVTH